MIDIHTHIIPGVDDGSPDLTDSLLMCELALEGGTDTVIATPHSHVPGIDARRHRRQILDGFRVLREAAAERRLPLRLLLGMEIFCAEDLRQGLEEGLFLPMNGTDFCLIEFRFGASAAECRSYINIVKECGRRPVIAHPERYVCVQRDTGEARLWVQEGCRLQINKSSFFGSFGRASRKAAFALLEEGLAEYVGSDAHSPYRRTTYMGDVREFLEEEYSRETAGRLLLENAERDFLLR